MQSSLESDLTALLADLLAGQGDLLETLGRKQRLLGAADLEGLTAVNAEEERLLGILQDCLQRREELLARAAGEGLPCTSIKALAAALPPAERKPLNERIEQAGARARLLQHQSLTNWVVIQRTLIHLSQLLEIIATGGRLQPTYGEGGRGSASGVLVDRAA
jgi:flagellar biosynthesis/type III secretory pathway chaperone